MALQIVRLTANGAARFSALACYATMVLVPGVNLAGVPWGRARKQGTGGHKGGLRFKGSVGSVRRLGNLYNPSTKEGLLIRPV